MTKGENNKIQENEIKLPSIFAHGMVIQRNQVWRVWGHVHSGVKVVVELFEESECTNQAKCITLASAVGDDANNFEIEMEAQPASINRMLVIRTEQSLIELHDIAFGDVWVVGGQSNAQLPLRRVLQRYPNAIEQAHDRGIRVFQAPEAFNFHGPQDDCPIMHWTRFGIDNPSEISALASFFAEEIRATVKVPIGIIATGLGGTPIEAWMSEAWLKRLDLLPENYDRLRNDSFIQQIRESDIRDGAEYDAQMDALDEGLGGKWSSPDYDDLSWDAMSLDESSRQELRSPGVIWLRHDFEVPSQFVGKSAVLNFGTMQDADEIFINGELIGHTDYQYPPRIYHIDSLAEHIQITIRLKVHYGTGGFTVGKKHFITVLDPARTQSAPIVLGVIDCDRDEDGNAIQWKFKRSFTFRERRQQTFFQYEPAGPYNAVLAPWAKAGITGFIWYQGESNTGESCGYGGKLIGLVQCWRNLFSRSDAPFIVVQLPNNALEPYNNWPALRNEQRKVMLLDNTALVTTADLGEDNDLHPTDKLNVAKRVAIASLSLAYQSGEQPMGPFAWRAVLEKDNHLSVHFTCVQGGLSLTRDTVPLELMCSGARKATLVLHACIAGPNNLTAVIPSDIAVSSGSSLRYAWNDSPDLVIWDKCGLPASPFEIPIVRKL